MHVCCIRCMHVVVALVIIIIVVLVIVALCAWLEIIVALLFVVVRVWSVSGRHVVNCCLAYG